MYVTSLIARVVISIAQCTWDGIIRETSTVIMVLHSFLISQMFLLLSSGSNCIQNSELPPFSSNFCFMFAMGIEGNK